ncbi:SKP1-like protein 4 [Linum grandiflorum]
MFELEKSAAEQSKTIKKLIKEMGKDGAIPLDNVTGLILRRVIKYCRMHTSAADEADKVRKWDQEFVKVNLAMLFDLILAADYLNIKELLDLTCRRASHMISEKTTEEMRKIFNIKNDFTPEEEANIRIENRSLQKIRYLASVVRRTYRRLLTDAK